MERLVRVRGCLAVVMGVQEGLTEAVGETV